MSIQQQDVTTDDIIRFFRTYYKDSIAELAQHYPNEQQSLFVDYDDLYQWNHRFAEEFVENPENHREYLEGAVSNYDLPADVDLSGANVRVFNLPESTPITDAGRHKHTGTLVQIRGQVSKKSEVRPKITEAAFECQRCGTMSYIPQIDSGFQEPHECQGCDRQGPFRVNHDQSSFVDHQFARVQQPPSETKGGNAEHLDVHLTEDLTDSFGTGDRIRLTAVQQLEKPNSQDFDGVFETSLEGRSVIREESDFEDIDTSKHKDVIEEIAAGEHGDPYDLLTQSINPTHHGDEKVKLAIGLQLFGGWTHHYPDGKRDRGDSHILLLGDPGCGKSSFLKAVDEIAPRSTFASGKGGTAAGMTAAAVRDDFGSSEWGLEAGAMVLADGGIACIDEIDKMEESAVSSMHEALESQQVNINKAGINATLNSRTALLAAGNPADGRFDPHRPKAEQIDLAPALMTRFDLMFMVSDKPDPKQDRKIVETMIDSRQASAKYTLGDELTEDERGTIEPAIDPEVLRAYIAYAKQTCFPRIDEDDVKEKVEDYYVSFRNAEYKEEGDSPIPISPRKVEAIQRLAEASARVRLSKSVKTEDVQRAVDLVEKSMREVGYDPETDQFDVDVVETGSSKSQRDRIKTIKKIIRELEEPTRDSILSAAPEYDLSPGLVDDEIDKMKRKGELYHPSSDSEILFVT